MNFWSRIFSLLSKGHDRLPGSRQLAVKALMGLSWGCHGVSVAGLLLFAAPVAADLPEVIDHVKPSIVVVGTYQLTRSPQFVMRGTGFVVGDGHHVATNSHVLPDKINEAAGERLVIMARSGGSSLQQREARSVAVDKAHDLALLRVDGPRMPALTLHDSERVREGQAVAFTGFPIGAVLGLSPVTHRGIIASITPIVLPSANARNLNAKVIARLRSGSFDIFQLDATAYPGNSGGPLYEVGRGEVVGIINMVFVKESKESTLSKPSGISFAIPSEYLSDLLRDANL
jgi:serine protease Do